jgi:hypothetical protein
LVTLRDVFGSVPSFTALNLHLDLAFLARQLNSPPTIKAKLRRLQYLTWLGEKRQKGECSTFLPKRTLEPFRFDYSQRKVTFGIVASSNQVGPKSAHVDPEKCTTPLPPLSSVRAPPSSHNSQKSCGFATTVHKEEGGSTHLGVEPNGAKRR